MPLGHNRQPPEFGKIVPDNCLSGRLKCPAGFGPAVLLSLGLHLLAGLLFWRGLIGSEREDRAGTRIIDTRVRDARLEVEVCLKVLDFPKAGLKKGNPKLVSPTVLASPPRPAMNDPRKSTAEQATTWVAGAESSKPRQSNHDLPFFTGGSKTQPRPPEVWPGEPGRLTPPSEPQYCPDGSPGGSDEGQGTTHSRTRFFQFGVRAKSVAYVIDRSVSMGPSGGLIRAKQELLASLRGMPVDTQFQIIIFNRSVQMLEPGSVAGLLAASPENKQKAAAFLASVQPEGGTLPVPALKRALALKPDVIFFLSDAADWTNRQVQEVTLANRGHTVIHVVAFDVADKDQLDRPLQVLARNNQGEYRAVSLGGKESMQLRGN